MHLWIIDERYRVGNRVRQHGLVDVYEGVDVETGEPVHVKQFAPELAQNMDFVEGWRSQLLSVQELDDPAVQQILAFGQGPEETLYQVEAPAPGISLRRWLQHTDGTMSVAASVRFVAKIAEALSAVHRDGISHGALSPETIYVVEDEPGTTRPVFTDWELSELFAVGAGRTRLRRYLPPERHVLPEAPHTPSTDVYALGSVLYELLTQETPYPPGTYPQEDDEDVSAIPPSRYNPKIPESVERVLLRALDPDPAMRPPHAGALARSLRKSLTEQPSTESIRVPADRTTVVSRSDTATVRPVWLVVASLVTILLIVIVALAWQLSYRSEEQPPVVGTTPNLVGVPLDTADQLARSDGLTLEVSGTVTVSDQPPDTVLRQEPGPGQLVPENRVIRVTVAGEPPTPAAMTTVPNLFSVSVPVAERLLRENGLRLGDERAAHDDAVPAGLILEQNPRAGIMVAEDTAVDVIVSRGPPPTPPSQ